MFLHWLYHNAGFSPKRERKRIKEYSSKFTSITQSPVANEDLEKKAEVAGKSSKQSVSMQNEGRCCRELLKEIQDLTYLCESLKQDLQKALGKFHPLVPSENGIFMQVTLPRKNIVAKSKKSPLATGPQSQKKEYVHLPLWLRLKRKNSHPIQLPCQPKKPATLPQSQKKSFNICHNLANNPKEVFIKREKEEKDDTLKMTSTSEQDTQPFFNENITPLPQNTTIPITSGTCDEPKMQKTTSTTILSTAKECDQLIPVSLTDDNCPDPKSWLHPQDPGKKSDTLKAIAINKETSAEQDTHPFIKENATHSLKSTTISINTGTCDDSMQDTTSTNLSSGITKEYNWQIPVLVIDDSSPDPKSWLHLQDPASSRLYLLWNCSQFEFL